MADLSSIQTIRELVKKALWQAKRPKSDKMRFLEFAIDGIRELRLYHVREGIKVTKNTLSDINTFDFPSDMEDYVAIGIPIDGELYTLTRKDTLITTTTTVEEEETLDSDDGEGVAIDDSQPASFAASGGVNIHGYYYADWEQRRFVINSNSRSEILLYYISNGIDNSDDSVYVPKKYVPALIAYIVWQDSCFVAGQENRAQYLEQQWEKRKHELKESELPSLDEIADELWALIYQTPRR